MYHAAMNRFSRLMIVTVGALFCAVLAGAVVGAAGGWLYLIAISPAIAAIAAGMAGRSLIGVLRVRNRRWAAAAGALTGILTMAAILLVSVQMERAAIIAELSVGGGVSDETLKRRTDYIMGELTDGASPAAAPVMYRLHSGVKLFGDTALDIGPGFNLGILLLELAVVIALCVRLFAERAGEPFCDPCDAWYARRMVGSAALGDRASVLVDLQNARFHRLGRRLEAAKETTRHPLILHGWFCDTCDAGDVRFELEVTEASKKPRIIKSVEAPHSALEAILDSQALKG